MEKVNAINPIFEQWHWLSRRRKLAWKNVVILVLLIFFFFWQFHQKEPAYVKFDFAVPRGSSVGIYARKNAIPTLTLNDVRDVLTGFKEREKRSPSNSNLVSPMIPQET